MGRVRVRASGYAAAVAAVGLLNLAGCAGMGGQPRSAGAPQRIISLAPSITETLFALGCGDRVVAVTDFCAYPADVVRLPRVGGYVNPNYEQILALKPDLVLLLREQLPVESFLKANGIAFLAIDDHDVPAVLESFRLIGTACGVAARGDSLARALDSELRGEPVAGPRPTVLLCAGRRDLGAGAIADVFAAGGRSYYQGLLDASGASNALSDTGAAYPSVSVEAILRLAPDIIVDAAPTAGEAEAARIASDWLSLGAVPAVAHGMVFCLTGSYVTVPGPRMALLLRDLRRVVGRWRDAQSSGGGGGR